MRDKHMIDEKLLDKRYVGHIVFSNSKTGDNTAHLRTYLAGLVEFAGNDGFPSKLDFYITKNKNFKLTDRNEILSIKDIPIIPPIFNPNPYAENRDANYNRFLLRPRTIKEVKENPNAIANVSSSILREE